MSPASRGECCEQTAMPSGKNDDAAERGKAPEEDDEAAFAAAQTRFPSKGSSYSYSADGAPAESGDAQLPKRKRSYQRLAVLAAGHAKHGGPPMLVDQARHIVLKPLQDIELSCYTRMWARQNGGPPGGGDPICSFVSKFYGVTQDVDEDGVSNAYISLDNLLYGFDLCPKVMDVKLGVRTFCEDECANMKLRPDLYEKLVKLYPSELTEEDHALQAITKHRWMSTRDRNSTAGTLGFRIDGVGGFENVECKDHDKRYSGFTTVEDVRASFLRFTLEASDRPLHSAEQMLNRLRAFRSAIAQSPFVQEHEFIGSSLLIVIGAGGEANFGWIDFGKTQLLPAGVQIAHDRPWNMGNHEDGLFTGVDNMVSIWSGVVEDCRAAVSAGHEYPAAKSSSASSLASG